MGLFKKKIDYFFIITGTIEYVIAEMRYSYLQIEKYIADKITSLCEKRDISDCRLHMSHYVFDTEKWPLFEFKAFRTDEEEYYLFVGIDLLIADGGSVRIFIRQWCKIR